MPLQSEAEKPGTLWGKALPLADGPKEPPIYKPNQRRAGFGFPVIIYYAYYMDIAAVIRPAAEIFGLTEAELTEAAHQYKAAKAEATARETTTRATVEPRPEAAATETTNGKASDGLQWPTETWDNSDEKAFHKRHAIVAFLRRVWKPAIERNGAPITREFLKERDEGAAEAVKGYIRYNKLPDDLPIFTLDQVTEYLTKRPSGGNGRHVQIGISDIP